MSIQDFWQRLVTVHHPPLGLVSATALVAVVLIRWRPSWRVLRGVVTIAHEGGHAVVAVLTGRRLRGIRLHFDTSGSTHSAGRQTGLGRVLTLVGGYLGPSALGLGGAALLGNGFVTALLWISIGLLSVVLLQIRNVYGVVSVVGTGVALVALSWLTSPTVQAVFGYLLTWFLLFAAPRDVLGLHRQHRRGQCVDSDPDQLASITPIPAGGWIAFFGVLTLAAAGLGVYWLLFDEVLSLATQLAGIG